MTKTNQNKTTGIEQTNAAAVAAADELTAARDNAVAAFKTAAKSAATQTNAALRFVAAYYAAKGVVAIDKETRDDLRKKWKDAGNTTKYESAVFYRVLKTCEKNAAIVAAAFENGKDAAQAARDSLLAAGVGLTSCKNAADSKESTTSTTTTTKKDDAATKESAAPKDAAERLKVVLDYVASCGDSAFAAIAAAVEKRRAVSEKMSKTA